MNFDHNKYRYNSKRTLTYAKNGMVATSHPLAAIAGLDILKKGGNAIDAAIATAVALTVLEPTSNGIGGDAFALLYVNGELKGINGSGYAPSKLTYDKIIEKKELKKDKENVIDPFSWEAITVPGACAMWNELHKKYGSMEFYELFKPAIKYAEEGFPVYSTVAYFWKLAFKKYLSLKEKYLNIFKDKSNIQSLFDPWFYTFTKDNKPPEPGDTFYLPDHARTLKSIAKTNSKSFYQGEIAEKIVEFSKKTNGFLEYKDLENYKPEWVNPLKVNYREYEIYELPPNTQGLVALIAFNILKNIDIKSLNFTERTHYMVEAIKIGFYEGKKVIGDPEFNDIIYTDFIKDLYGKEKFNQISNFAKDYEVEQYSGGTVYLATADKYGNMVSFIQSNYMGFGSGLVVPGTGIALHNRGANFILQKNHPNSIEPLKRPYHTIIPGFLMKNGNPIGPFGVMGGFMQPQGHLQVISNLIDYNMNPQEALDCPRWQWIKNKKIYVENDFDKASIYELTKKGHEVIISTLNTGFGRGQIIIAKNGIFVGGTEKRCDGYIAIY